MSPFETAFAAWLLFISNQGVDIQSQLLPPASQEALAQLSESIGYELPEDFTQLYLTANGQLDPYWGDKSFTGTYSPLFGWYEFIPLEKVSSNYSELADIRNSILPDIYEVDVREGDPVVAVDWQPGWVPFAVSNAAYYGVDLTPPRGGTYGQVIEFGHDTSENRVLASSITEFLALAVKNLDPNEPYRYEFYEANPDEQGGRNFSTLFFNMDWTQTPEPPVDTSHYQPDPQMEAWNQANKEAVSGYVAWLEGKGFTQQELDAFERWTFEMHMPMSMRMGGLLSPPMPNDNLMPVSPAENRAAELASLSLALRSPTNYIVEELPVSLEEAFTLLHEYRLLMGMWDQQQFDAAEQVINRDRPARKSITDADAHSYFSSMDSQPDGSVLLCMESIGEDGTMQKECETFLP